MCKLQNREKVDVPQLKLTRFALGLHHITYQLPYPEAFMKSKVVRVHRRHSNAKVDPSVAAKMHIEGKSLRAIARELGVSRMAVARAIQFVEEQARSKSTVGEVSAMLIPEPFISPAALRERKE